MQVFAETLILEFGYIGSFLLVLLEYANFPIPSELVLPLIGLFSSEYHINLFLIIAISTIAGVTGSLINYYIGFKYGKNLLNILCKKFRFLKEPIISAESYIFKYGKIAVLITRIVPLARTTISLISGIYKIPLKIFILYSSIGIFIWNSILIILGYFLTNNLVFVKSIISRYSIVCIIIIMIIVTIIAIRKFKKNK